MHRSPRPHRLAARLLAAAALVLSLAGCETTILVPDQRPTVTLTSGPIDTVSAPQSWLVDIAWVGSDPGGRIDHYEYAIDPPPLRRVTFAHAETAWVQTRETHVVARFRASHADSLGPGATASEFHVFVLRAVDNHGRTSPNVVRAFYAYTVAPDVRFTDPAPNRFLIAHVGPPFRLSWTGNDPDGAGTNRPAAYRLKLLSLDGGENTQFVVDPDSLLKLGAATGWLGWATVGGDTTSITMDQRGLQPGTRWMAAIVAVDEAGAATPYVSFDANLLAFDVVPNGGPSVHVFASFIDYTSPPSALAFSPGVEVPAGRPLTFKMEGIASAGRHITGTRWALDITDIDDDTPRSDEATDLGHWSPLQTGVISATFPIATPGEHRLAIDTYDDFGGRSVLFVVLNVIEIRLARDLLVVDDTRLEVDKFSAGTVLTYTRPWPSAAELDTFLYARGGVPWRGTKDPPTGALSPPGLLAGYAFDTLGTRLGLEMPANGVPLSTLSQYKHVLWLVDATSSQYSAALVQSLFPVTVLRAMSRPGAFNTLEEYVRWGGQVWLAGGGAAYASLAEFDQRSNNQGQLAVFSVSAGELGPGRLLYDMGHIRSAMGVTKAELRMTRSPAAIGGWSGHGTDGTLAAPNYANAPESMRPRDPATDPLPPTRLPSQAALYYPTSFPAGLVIEPNAISEDFDPDPAVERIESALDTLYDARGAVLPLPSAPVMLYYHGRENAPFVYTGFEPWDFTRADCQGLFDLVLGDIWKLTKAAPVGGAARAAGVNAPRPAATRATRALDPRRVRP